MNARWQHSVQKEEGCFRATRLRLRRPSGKYSLEVSKIVTDEQLCDVLFGSRKLMALIWREMRRELWAEKQRAA